MIYDVSSYYRLPEVPGVYIFETMKRKILYVGKAKNIKKRVSWYFQKDKTFDQKRESLTRQINKIEIIPLPSEFEALLLEAKLIKTYQPKYNVRWRDDKHYLYIKITQEDFPRVLFARKKTEPQATYFGPFPSASIVREILFFLRKIFPYCTQKASLKKACFYTHLGLCNPCPGQIKKYPKEKYRNLRQIYLKNIRQIKLLLGEKAKKVKEHLEKEMRVCAEREEYEQAAILRDKLQKLDFLTKEYKPTEAYIENPNLTEQMWKNEQESLSNILSKFFPQLFVLKRIECYDVSNISGKLATGSMVTFINGQPNKNYYRRFRIKTQEKPDDLAMLSEIIKRRLKHQDWRLPDLLVIDGGRPQLLALKKVLHARKFDLPIIGLAKKEEEIVAPYQNNFVKLKLPADSPALHLIQKLRDEAHRFAFRYHELLRLKHLLGHLEKKARL